MKKFNHVNIVKFIELISTKKSLYIVTEFCKDGDLKQLLYKKNLQEKEVINIMT
jgi:calcium-dependent protein kinase